MAKIHKLSYTTANLKNFGIALQYVTPKQMEKLLGEPNYKRNDYLCTLHETIEYDTNKLIPFRLEHCYISSYCIGYIIHTTNADNARHIKNILENMF